MKLFSLFLASSNHVFAELRCRDGSDEFNGKCYFYSDVATKKPDAKRFCWERDEGQLLLISSQSENDYFTAKVTEKGATSYWLRINDKNDEDQWVVDRRGYEKPTSWASQEYFSWNPATPNAVGINSAVLTASGMWNRNDKFAISEFVCEGDKIEIEPRPGQRNFGPGDGGARNVENPDVLKCWKCSAKNFGDCDTYGSLETCASNAKSCEYEVRHRWGHIININTGCKAPDACENNKSQNFRGMAKYTQCRPEGHYRHSVCRQCCQTNNCVKEPEWKIFTTRSEWSQTLA